jgi:FlaA1/EpsC-like NDP-sugar epimerase
VLLSPEAALYTIDQTIQEEVQRKALDVEIVALIGSVHHQNRMREVLETYAVDTLYHAAAYKHVPLVEHNMIEGVHNNVFGTWHAAEAAIAAGVKSFVLVSSDKAVLPTNVMGATKRFSELLLQGLHQRGSVTKFSMVRFGNVLASSGSVVPLFREQIRNRRAGNRHSSGNLPVLHDDTGSRVASSSGRLDGEGRRRFRARHGKPVRIRDLAEK